MSSNATNLTTDSSMMTTTGNISALENMTTTIADIVTKLTTTVFENVTELVTANMTDMATHANITSMTTTTMEMVTSSVMSQNMSTATTGSPASTPAITTTTLSSTPAITMTTLSSTVLEIGSSAGRDDLTTTVDTMKDFYRGPLIAMSILACLFFLLLVVICVCWYKRRGKTVYQTMDITPKKRVSKNPDVESHGKDQTSSAGANHENGKSPDEVRLEVMEGGVVNPTYDKGSTD